MLGLARGALELRTARWRPRWPACSARRRDELGLLLERADGRPEGALERPRLTGEQRLLAERVADVTAEVEEVALLPLEQHAAALGTDHGGRAAERRRVPEGRRAGHRRIGRVGAAGGKVPRRIGRKRLPLGVVLPRHPVQDGPELPGRRDVIHRDAPERAHDHAGIGSLLGLLHQGEPAAGLDLDQAVGAVVQGSGQDHADDPGPERPRRAPEERVDRWAVSLLPGPVSAADATAAPGPGGGRGGRRRCGPARWARRRPPGRRRARRPAGGCRASALTLWGGKWCTTNMAPGKSAGSAPTSRSRGRCPRLRIPPPRCRELACRPVPFSAEHSGRCQGGAKPWITWIGGTLSRWVSFPCVTIDAQGGPHADRDR